MPNGVCLDRSGVFIGGDPWRKRGDGSCDYTVSTTVLNKTGTGPDGRRAANLAALSLKQREAGGGYALLGRLAATARLAAGTHGHDLG